MSVIHNPGWRETYWRQPSEAEAAAAEIAFAAGTEAANDANPYDEYFQAFEWRAWETARARLRYDAWLATAI